MNNNIKDRYILIRKQIFDALEVEAINNLSKTQLATQLEGVVGVIADRQGWILTPSAKKSYIQSLIDELQGLGPLQALLEDPSVDDIMINNYQNVYVERSGVIHKTDIHFLNEEQLRHIANRIAINAGRHVDEASPTCDARLNDGSRVNIVIPPVSIDGTSISIRKFRKNSLDLSRMVQYGTINENMAQLLKVIAKCRLNVLISGGTGSGKTTLLNAMSQYISANERIVTIEDAAELKLQQTNVVRLETRIKSAEGVGAIDQRDLVVNALRMRPDRIIVGECRSSEAFEMLQAMNTGHDGSMSTLHANTARDAIARVESMTMMANSHLTLAAIKKMVISAIDVIIQINRMHDGSRKVVSISEVMGLEGDSPVLEDIFNYESTGNMQGGLIQGRFVSAGLCQRSVLNDQAKLFGMQEEVNQIFKRTRV